MTCPVCRARYRGSAECSRCGADLTMVMTLVASAWKLRQAARRALEAGDYPRALELAGRAQQYSATPAGRNLEGLAGWLAQQGEPAIATRN